MTPSRGFVAGAAWMTVALLVAALGTTLPSVFAQEEPPPAEEAAPGGEVPLGGIAQDRDGPSVETEVAVGPVGWSPLANEGVASALTRLDGTFEISGAPLGPVDVWLRPRDGEWKFGRRLWNPGPSRLQLDATPWTDRDHAGSFGRRPAGVLRGEVTDKRGRALAGARVGAAGDERTWVLTDSEGAFELGGVEDGDGLAVRHDGFEWFLGEVELGRKRGVKIKLEPAPETEVRVLDPDGEPVPRAWVTLGSVDRIYGTDGFTAMFPPRPRLVGAWTDAEGIARLRWGHHEEPVAWAHAHGFGSARAEPKKGKRTVELQLTPPSPAVATVVYEGTGDRLPGILLTLPGLGHPRAISASPRSHQRGNPAVGRTDDQGRLHLAHLDPAVETLWVDGQAKMYASVTVERPAARGR